MNLIFDIGYNLGNFSAACFDKFADTKVVGVDANPIFATELDSKLTMAHSVIDVRSGAKNWKDHNRQNDKYIHNKQLVVEHALVGSKDLAKTHPFYISEIEHGVSSASEKFLAESRFALGSPYVPLLHDPATNSTVSRWTRKENVPTTTLDRLVAAHGKPDLIKLDIEGFEYQALSSLSKKQKEICFEWTEEGAEELFLSLAHLKSIGYEKFGSVGYFDEKYGTQVQGLTPISSDHSHYLQKPEEYHPYDKCCTLLQTAIAPSRRINWGMVWCK